MVLSQKDAQFLANLISIRSSLKNLMPTTVSGYAKMMTSVNETLAEFIKDRDAEEIAEFEKAQKKAVAHD